MFSTLSTEDKRNFFRILNLYLEETLVCPITQEPIKKPVLLYPTFFENDAIRKWLDDNSIHPITKKNAMKSELIDLPFLNKIFEDLGIHSRKSSNVIREAEIVNHIHKKLNFCPQEEFELKDITDDQMIMYLIEHKKENFLMSLFANDTLPINLIINYTKLCITNGLYIVCEFLFCTYLIPYNNLGCFFSIYFALCKESDEKCNHKKDKLLIDLINLIMKKCETQNTLPEDQLIIFDYLMSEALTNNLSNIIKYLLDTNDLNLVDDYIWKLIKKNQIKLLIYLIDYCELKEDQAFDVYYLFCRAHYNTYAMKIINKEWIPINYTRNMKNDEATLIIDGDLLFDQYIPYIPRNVSIDKIIDLSPQNMVVHKTTILIAAKYELETLACEILSRVVEVFMKTQQTAQLNNYLLLIDSLKANIFFYAAKNKLSKLFNRLMDLHDIGYEIGINCINITNNTPLSWLLSHKLVNESLRLIRTGIFLMNHPNIYGLTSFFYTVMNKVLLDILLEFLKIDPDNNLSIMDYTGDSIFGLLTWRTDENSQYVEIMRKIVKNHPEYLNLINQDGITPLATLCTYNVTYAKELFVLNHGIQNFIHSDGSSLLTLCLRRSHVFKSKKETFDEICTSLIDTYPELLYTVGKNKNTPLTLACSLADQHMAHKIFNKLKSDFAEDHTESKDYNYRRGYTLRSYLLHQNDQKQNTLMLCVKQSWRFFFKELLEIVPESLSHYNTRNENALILACTQSEVLIPHLILNNKHSDPNLINSNGENALIISSKRIVNQNDHTIDFIIRIINLTQNKSHYNNQNKTALFYAIHSVPWIASLLLNYDSCLHEIYNNGETSLIICIKNERFSLAYTIITKLSALDKTNKIINHMDSTGMTAFDYLKNHLANNANANDANDENDDQMYTALNLCDLIKSLTEG